MTEVVMIKHGGKRETETAIFDEPDGIDFMVSADGSMSIELYKSDKRANSLMLRVDRKDVIENRNKFERLAQIRE